MGIRYYKPKTGINILFHVIDLTGEQNEQIRAQITANEVRKGIVTAVHSAKAGHRGGSLSAADIFTYLYFEEMNIDPEF